MTQSLDGQTIHVDDKGITYQQDSNYSMQDVLDSTSEIISYYGAKSQRISLTFIMLENDNGGSGNSTLLAAAKANSDINLTLNTGSVGNFRILSYKAVQLQALNFSLPVYSCTADLISTS